MKKLLYIDVMVEDKFYCTIKYPYHPLFTIDLDKVSAFVEEKLPTLKKREYHLAFNETGRCVKR